MDGSQPVGRSQAYYHQAGQVFAIGAIPLDAATVEGLLDTYQAEAEAAINAGDMQACNLAFSLGLELIVARMAARMRSRAQEAMGA